MIVSPGDFLARFLLPEQGTVSSHAGTPRHVAFWYLRMLCLSVSLPAESANTVDRGYVDAGDLWILLS